MHDDDDVIDIKAPYSLNRQSKAVILIHPTRHSKEIKRFYNFIHLLRKVKTAFLAQSKLRYTVA